MDWNQKKVQLITKDIREAINDKNHFLVIQQCEELVKVDPVNYMGLVILGAFYQRSNKVKAHFWLRKAVSCSSEPTEALWELTKCAPLDELPEIYENLLFFNPKNYRECHEKLAELALFNADVRCHCVRILKKEESKADTIIRWRSSQLSLVKVLSFQEELNDADQKLYKYCLESLIADRTTPQYRLECSKLYWELLYKFADYENLVVHAVSMIKVYPLDPCPLEWICKVYCENYKLNPSVLSCIPERIDWYEQKLKELKPDSSEALLVDVVRAIDDEQVCLARSLLHQILQIEPNNVTALELLAQTEMLIGAYAIALPIMRSLGWKNAKYGVCLSYSNDSNDLNEAVAVLSALKQTDDVLDSLARCFVRLGEEKKLNELSLPPILQIRYRLAPKEGLDVLDIFENAECFETLMERGKLNFALENFNVALACLMEATRLKPYRAECFWKLGVIYMALGIKDRAWESWQTAKHLNPFWEEVDLYFCKYLNDHPVEMFLEKNLNIEEPLLKGQVESIDRRQTHPSPIRMIDLFTTTTPPDGNSLPYRNSPSRARTAQLSTVQEKSTIRTRNRWNSPRPVYKQFGRPRGARIRKKWAGFSNATSLARQERTEYDGDTSRNRIHRKRRSEYLTPPHNNAKKRKAAISSPTFAVESESPDPRRSLTVAVLPKQYPHTKLSAEEIAALEDAIFEEISIDKGLKPQFEGTEFKSGMLLVQCTNSQASDWLTLVIPSLRNWQGPELIARLEDCLITLNLLNSSGQTREKTMSLIESQNDGLNTKAWVVFECRDTDRDQILTIGLDKESLSTINRQGNSIHYRFGKVPVAKRSEDGQPVLRGLVKEENQHIKQEKN